MGLKSIEIIIGASLVLNKFPKYWDKIKLNWHSIPSEKNIFVSGYSTYCCGAWDSDIIQSELDSLPKNSFRLWLQYYYVAWEWGLKKMNQSIKFHWKKIFLFLVHRKRNITVSGFTTTTIKHETLKISIGPQRICFHYFFQLCAVMHGNRKALDEKSARQKWEYMPNVHAQCTCPLPNAKGCQHYHLISILLKLI